MGGAGVGSCLKVGFEVGSVMLSLFIHRTFITLRLMFLTVSRDTDTPMRKECLVC